MSGKYCFATDSLWLLQSFPDQGCPLGLWWYYGSQTSTQIPVAAGHGSHHVSGISAGHSHWAVPHNPPVFSSTSFHCVHTFVLLFLSHLSSTYLLILVVPRPLSALCPEHAAWWWMRTVCVSSAPSAPSGCPSHSPPTPYSLN